MGDVIRCARTGERDHFDDFCDRDVRFDHLRFDQSRRDGINGDAAFAQFDGERLDCANQTCF